MAQPRASEQRASYATGNPGYYSPDPMSPTFSPPADYAEFQSLRPGTPGSFGRYSVHSNLEKYDRDALVTPSPSHQGLLTGEDGQRAQRSSTYYFNKEGGRATPESGFYQYEGRRGQGYNPAAYSAAAGGGAAGAAAAGKRQGFIRRRPILFSFIIIAILAVAGIAAGVAISQVNKSNDKNLASTKGNSGSNSNDSSSSGHSGSTSTGSGSSNSTPTTTKITPFAHWDWTDTNTKAYGVSLGSWLLLERWQLEDWMVQEGGSEAWDEWRFVEALGDRAASVLTDHQNTWITEADMDTFQNAGINLVRIPIGFWAFIPTVGNEPYVTTGYVDQLNKMLKWCYDRGMYVMLDLHGMPGSQNGDQSSGLNTTNIQWYEQTNQDRSDAFLKAVLDWYKASEYSSIINSIGVVNEPRIVNDNWAINNTRFQIASDYYERSYETCLKYNITMTFHNGFAPGSTTDKMNRWRSFATGKNPQYLLYEDHPYPGWFQDPSPGSDAIQTSVCEYGTAADGYPIPVIIGEYSAVNDLNSTSYTKSYLEMQMATYGWSAGTIFWNFKANTSKTQILAERDMIMNDYSFLDLLSQGIMPTPGKGNSVRSFYQSLSNPCGSFRTYGWSNPSDVYVKIDTRNSHDSRSCCLGGLEDVADEFWHVDSVASDQTSTTRLLVKRAPVETLVVLKSALNSDCPTSLLGC
ncbi:glycoside hydrolase [Testicularia cyperi]|uniref:glucan 1,3-beta-glucosidase n=1 Tax=Testicularia cyperi TaxID=1882483 RepID=A0A317XKX8_9BASI|nr:glycoside hydrolase [Testicularia cyperi]